MQMYELRGCVINKCVYSLCMIKRNAPHRRSKMYKVISSSDRHYSFVDGIVPSFPTEAEAAEEATRLTNEWDIEGCTCPAFTASEFSE